jgi:ATP adenylyltransferase
MNHLKWIVGILSLMLAFIVAVQNYETLVNPVPFKLNFYFFEYQTSGMPLSLVAIITFLIGLFSAWIYGIKERFGLKKQIKSLTKEAQEKNNELNSLRNLPVTTEGIISDQTTEEE